MTKKQLNDAIEKAISDRGICERDCTLPLPERVDNIICELKEWRWLASQLQHLMADLKQLSECPPPEHESLLDCIADIADRAERACE